LLNSLRGFPDAVSVGDRIYPYGVVDVRAADRATGEKLQDAVEEWDKWWQRYVSRARSKPPAPPEAISAPFVEAAGALLGMSTSHIGVLQSPGDLISDCLSIDLYEREARGHGGSIREDMIKRVRNVPGFKLPVTLALLAVSFRGSIPLLGIVGTAMHEGAHYRHYAFTRQLINKWHKRAKHKPSSGAIRESVALRDFYRYLRKQSGRRGTISDNERTIVDSTFRIVQATHPIAQFQAFIGNYSHYPRGRRTDRKDSTLILQPRFEQFLKGTDAWHRIIQTNIRDLCVQAIADFIKNDGTCTRKDVLALLGEFEQSQNRSAQMFFQKLKPVLNKR
jgi:hypothetical protein